MKWGSLQLCPLIQYHIFHSHRIVILTIDQLSSVCGDIGSYLFHVFSGITSGEVEGRLREVEGRSRGIEEVSWVLGGIVGVDLVDLIGILGIGHFTELSAPT